MSLIPRLFVTLRRMLDHDEEMFTQMDGRYVEKETGKGLSTNDYTTVEKTKLGGLADVKSIGSNLTLDPNTGELSADAQEITVDSALSTTSENPVQNKVTTTELNKKQEQIQFDTMPTASATYLGKIFQYVGTTDSTYTNGYWYECVEDSTTTPSTYSWAEKGGSSGVSDFDDLTNRPDEASNIDVDSLNLPLPSPVSHGIRYSTEEQVVGTWIDGKPIWQKTYTGLSISAPRGSWVSIDTTFTNIGNFVNCTVLAENNLMILPCTVYPTAASTRTGVRIQNSSSDETTRTVNTVTIQYTKTTDTAV